MKTKLILEKKIFKKRERNKIDSKRYYFRFSPCIFIVKIWLGNQNLTDEYSIVSEHGLVQSLKSRLSHSGVGLLQRAGLHQRLNLFLCAAVVLQSVPHRHGHHQLLAQLLLAKGHGSTGDHDALVASILKLSHLLHDRCQSTQGEAVAVSPGDDRTSQFNDHALGMLELTPVQEWLLRDRHVAAATIQAGSECLGQVTTQPLSRLSRVPLSKHPVLRRGFEGGKKVLLKPILKSYSHHRQKNYPVRLYRRIKNRGCKIHTMYNLNNDQTLIIWPHI